MPVIRAVVGLEVDGVPVPGFPLARRITVNEVQGFDYIKAVEGATALPLNQIGAAINALAVRPDAQVTIVLGQIKVNAGGLILVIDGDLGTGAQATVANASAGVAQVRGVGAGS
jgi:hypothetical protein